MKYFFTIGAIILPVFVIILIVSQILLTNELAGAGSKIQNLDTEYEMLVMENERLNQEIASASSLVTVKEKARTMGFVEGKSYLTLSESQFPVAFGTAR